MAGSLGDDDIGAADQRPLGEEGMAMAFAWAFQKDPQHHEDENYSIPAHFQTQGTCSARGAHDDALEETPRNRESKSDYHPESAWNGCLRNPS